MRINFTTELRVILCIPRFYFFVTMNSMLILKQSFYDLPWKFLKRIRILMPSFTPPSNLHIAVITSKSECTEKWFKFELKNSNEMLSHPKTVWISSQEKPLDKTRIWIAENSPVPWQMGEWIKMSKIKLFLDISNRNYFQEKTTSAIFFPF